MQKVWDTGRGWIEVASFAGKSSTGMCRRLAVQVRNEAFSWVWVWYGWGKKNHVNQPCEPTIFISERIMSLWNFVSISNSRFKSKMFHTTKSIVNRLPPWWHVLQTTKSFEFQRPDTMRTGGTWMIWWLRRYHTMHLGWAVQKPTGDG